MKHYRPLIIQSLRLGLPGLELLRLRLNQAAPEPVQWSEHRHDHSQIIIYLMGRGTLRVGGKMFQCREGSLVHIAPGTDHAFVRPTITPPFCLILDLNFTDRQMLTISTGISLAETRRLRLAMKRLFTAGSLDQRDAMLLVAGGVIAALEPTLKALGWLRQMNRFGSASQMSTARLVSRLLQRHEAADLAPEDIARRLGHSVEVLDRRLKAECGLTLGQVRTRFRIRKAQLLLLQGLPVAEVARRLACADVNYFTRWFRRHAGQPPLKWKKNPVMVEEV